MLNFISTILHNILAFAQIYGAKALCVLSKISTNFIADISSGQLDLFSGLTSWFANIIENIWGCVSYLVYLICKFVYMAIDFAQVIMLKFAGVQMSNTVTFNTPIFRIFVSDVFIKILRATFGFGIVLLILFTIIALIKSEYQIATGNQKLEGDYAKGSYRQVFKSTIYSALMMIFIPFVLIIAFAFSTVALSSINSVLNVNSSSVSIGGQLFTTTAYNANRYRIYANSNKRMPILIDYDDPFNELEDKDFTSIELLNLYKEWQDGESQFNLLSNGGFDGFANTLALSGNNIINGTNYQNYENWVSTAEQYQVMADFIDYAVQNNLHFYFKSATDDDIDYSTSTFGVPITDGVYDPSTSTFTIKYKNTTNVNGLQEDSYVLNLTASSVKAGSSLEDTIDAISVLLALSATPSSTVSLQPSTNTITTQEKQQFANQISLIDKSLQQLIATQTDTSGMLNTETRLFKILERQPNSTNVVRWKTERINFNEQSFTVYNLTKKYKVDNVIENHGTVTVATKQNGGEYYIVKKDGDSYKYTNQKIEYINDGNLYFDELEPVFVYVSWAEKLYNDLSVIYGDIFKNMVTYSNWSGTLGEFFAASNRNDIQSAQVSSFSTALIHPLGLIMSELFLGTSFEAVKDETTGGSTLVTDFAFTSSYLKETINDLTVTTSGIVKAPEIIDEIEVFIKIYNGLLTPILQDLKKIEGFSINGTNNEYDVYSYVYKAYLSSLLLTDSFNEYYTELAFEILDVNKLVNNMYKNSGSLTYDANGNVVYTFEYQIDDDGNLIKLQQNVPVGNSYKLGKQVYNSNGELAVVCDASGKVSTDDIYIPKATTRYIIEDGYYKVWNGTTYINYQDASWNSLFTTNFEQYYTINVTKEGEDYYAYLQVYNHKGDRINAQIVTVEIPENIQDAKIKTEDIKVKVDGESLSDFDIYRIQSNSADYFLYDGKYVAKLTYNSLIFKDLTNEEQNLLKNIVNYIQNDTDIINGIISEPTYLKYLQDYINYDGNNSENTTYNWSAVMNAKDITYSEAIKIEEKLEEMEDYVNTFVLGNVVNQSEIKKLINYRSQLNSYYKFQIIWGLNSYLSSRVSDSYTIVVNSHPYSVSQAMTTIQFLEFAFGNGLKYESLLKNINSETYYLNLSRLDSHMINLLQQEHFNELNILESVITTIEESNAITIFNFTETELEILNYYYNFYNKHLNNDKGYTLFTNKNLNDKNVGPTNINKIKTILTNYNNIQVLSYAFSAYINMSTFESTQKAMLINYIQDKSEDVKLYYVENDYNGIIGEDGKAFSSLKEFLTQFGNICLDLYQKTDFGSLSCYNISKDTEILYTQNGAVSNLVTNINNILKDLDFGSAETKITLITDLNNVFYDKNNNLQEYNSLSVDKKRVVVAIGQLYEIKMKEYEQELEDTKLAISRLHNFIEGRTRLYSSSDIYNVYLQDYLTYFTYNADISNKEDFIKNYVYEGYIDEIGVSKLSVGDLLQYYTLYKQCFENFVFNTSGITVKELSKMQNQVLLNCKQYYESKKDYLCIDNKQSTNDPIDVYNQNVSNYNIIKQYIATKSTVEKINYSVSNIQVNKVAAIKGLDNIIQDKTILEYVNLVNMLDYLGLDINYKDATLSNIKLKALEQLRNFEERAGETVTQIQCRYLSLLYVASSTTTTDPLNNETVIVDDTTKNIILQMAGLQDKAEELIVNLIYDNNINNADADEQFGSVFIICTKDETSDYYVPFVFASDQNSTGIPVSYYYSKLDEYKDGTELETTYYPVIAKGIFDEDGRPTAIRRVNGNIEFYRENVEIFNATQLDLGVYYQNQEQVSVSYSPVSVIINSVSKFITGKTLSEHIYNIFPRYKVESNAGYAYTVATSTIYHLQNGSCDLNYAFYPTTAIAIQHLYDTAAFNAVIMIFATYVVFKAIWSAMRGLIDSVLQLVVYIVVYPLTLGAYPLRQDSFNNWSKAIVKQYFYVYGFVLALNVYFILLALLQHVGQVLPSFSAESQATLNNTFLFNGINFTQFLAFISTTLCFIVAVTLLDSLSATFSKKLFASEDAKSNKVDKRIKQAIKDSQYVMSGNYIKDAAIDASTYVGAVVPVVGDKFNIEKGIQRRIDKDKDKVKNLVNDYKAKLSLNTGLSASDRDNAVKAYQDALEKIISSRQERLKNEQQRRVNRRSSEADLYGSGKSLKCPICGQVYKGKTGKYKYNKALKGKLCARCGKGVLK